MYDECSLICFYKIWSSISHRITILPLENCKAFLVKQNYQRRIWGSYQTYMMQNFFAKLVSRSLFPTKTSSYMFDKVLRLWLSPRTFLMHFYNGFLRLFKVCFKMLVLGTKGYNTRDKGLQKSLNLIKIVAYSLQNSFSEI